MASKWPCHSWSMIDYMRGILLIFCTLNILAQLVQLDSLTQADTFLVELNDPSLTIGLSHYVRTVTLLALSFAGSYGAVTGNLATLRVYGLLTFIYVNACLISDIERIRFNKWPETVAKFKAEMGQYQFSLKSNETANSATKRWDLIQSRLECCGSGAPSDWTERELPKTCCPCSTFYHRDACRLDGQDHWDRGCLGRLERMGLGGPSLVETLLHAVFLDCLASLALVVMRLRGREQSSTTSPAATGSTV